MKFKSLPDEAEASAPRKPPQDVPEGHQRTSKPKACITLILHPSNARDRASSGLKRHIPIIMPNTAHHENNPHTKRRLVGHEHMARTFTWDQAEHDSKRVGLGQDIRFFS